MKTDAFLKWKMTDRNSMSIESMNFSDTLSKEKLKSQWKICQERILTISYRQTHIHSTT